MQLYAPAKINLSFEIKGRREDGFHEIETLMAPISLVRTGLTIERAADDGEIRFSCDDSSLPVGEENLVVRAARLFQKATKIEGGHRDCPGEKNPAWRRPGRWQQRCRQRLCSD